MIQVSEAESHVMDVLWQASPLAAEEVIAALSERQAWQEATVKTLLNRLLNKQAIAAEKDGRRFLYRPLLQRDDYLQQQSSSLVDRLFDGRLAPLVSHFSAKRTLSADDIAELKQLIEDIEHGQ